MLSWGSGGVKMKPPQRQGGCDATFSNLDAAAAGLLDPILPRVAARLSQRHGPVCVHLNPQNHNQCAMAAAF